VRCFIGERVHGNRRTPTAQEAPPMDLLDFARGPALGISLTIFMLGTLWRLFAVLRLPAMTDLSPPREGAPTRTNAALGAIARGFWPRSEFGGGVHVAAFNGYVMHVGLALIVFGYAPHINFIRRLTGIGWPALPDAVMYLASGATMVSLLLALWTRLGDPVRRLISTTDDYLSWLLVFLPVFTGMAVMTGPSDGLLAREVLLYRTPLAVHLLTLELLLVWFPFGKLMHAVLFAFSRGATGIRFSHRGVRI
jgi:nitrate reductase gamma subunit